MNILLDLKSEYLRLFLAFIFEKDGDVFIASRINDFGKLCCSRYSKSEFPVKHEITENTVTIRLPKSNNIADSAARFYLYYKKEDMAKLNDELQAIANIDFDSYYLKGKKLKFQQKAIIDAYIYSRKLIFETDKKEMLKKREYRNEEKILNEMRIFLRNKANYYHERIDKNILSEINTCISRI